MIDGVLHIPLKVIPDIKGDVMHMLRADDPHFKGFGEVYFSWINPGDIKAWHLHTVMTTNLSAPVGEVFLAVYDGREGSPTYGEVQEFTLSPGKHSLLSIPPGLWYGFAGQAQTPSMLVSCATHPHDPQEKMRRDMNDSAIPYDWKKWNV